VAGSAADDQGNLHL